MSNKAYLIARLAFLGTFIALVYNIGITLATLVTSLVVLGGIIFAQATMISMYTAHRKQMQVMNQARNRINNKATKGPKQDREVAKKEIKAITTPQK